MEHKGCNVVPGINNTVDCSFKRGGEMVMFKIPVEHIGGNVVPVLKAVKETVPLSGQEKWV